MQKRSPLVPTQVELACLVAVCGSYVMFGRMWAVILRAWSEDWHKAWKLATELALRDGLSEADTAYLMLAAMQLNPNLLDLRTRGGEQVHARDIATILSAQDFARGEKVPPRRSWFSLKPKRTEWDDAVDSSLASTHEEMVDGRVVVPTDLPHLLHTCMQPGTRATRLLDVMDIDPVGHVERLRKEITRP